MEPRDDRGDENQKLLMDNECWDKIVQTGSFEFNMVEKFNQWSWLASIIKGRCDKRVPEWREIVESNTNTTVQLYLIILLGGGNTAEWVSWAIETENMAGQHCNHCQQ
jgi:hypothetical protein